MKIPIKALLFSSIPSACIIIWYIWQSPLAVNEGVLGFIYQGVIITPFIAFISIIFFFVYRSLTHSSTVQIWWVLVTLIVSIISANMFLVLSFVNFFK